MNFRKAVINDLKQLKCMYERIIEDMNKSNIEIWDEIYPCEFFEDDIKANRLYISEENNTIVSAFALLTENKGENAVEWQSKAEKSIYIDRFGVNVDFKRKGIGSFMLKKAMTEAKKLGADYLRLFVVDINKPAISLYEKNGFIKANGLYNEVIDEEFILREFGYEIFL